MKLGPPAGWTARAACARIEFGDDMDRACLAGSRSAAETFEQQRQRMVDKQLRGRGVRSPRVLAAMLAVPRHEFVPPEWREHAYSDQPLPIGHEQTISQPLMVAMMTEALELAGGERVLEIGTGSGYQTAVLAQLAREVYSTEYVRELADAARERLTRLGFKNVHIRHGDGGRGWPEAAPFDAILVAAAAPALPAPLTEQLAEGGRMVIPVGTGSYQELVRIEKRGGRIAQRSLDWCRFVPLVGSHGWERPVRE